MHIIILSSNTKKRKKEEKWLLRFVEKFQCCKKSFSIYLESNVICLKQRRLMVLTLGTKLHLWTDFYINININSGSHSLKLSQALQSTKPTQNIHMHYILYILNPQINTQSKKILRVEMNPKKEKKRKKNPDHQSSINDGFSHQSHLQASPDLNMTKSSSNHRISL